MRNTLIHTGLLTALMGTLYSPVIPFMVQHWWKDPNYSHGFLIPFMSLYFVWARRDRLKDLRPNPSGWGLLVIFAGLLIFIAGTIGAELFLMRSSMIFVLSGIVLYLLGREFFKALFFPLAYLLFMIPLPFIVFNAIAFPLQLLAARVSKDFLQLLSVPVLREGNIIFLPGTSLEVAEACSGIRSLVSLAALGVAFAYFTHKIWWKRVVLVVSTVPIAIVANVLRVSGTGFLAYHFGEESAEGFFHTFSGLLVFIVALLFLFVEGFLLGKICKMEG